MLRSLLIAALCAVGFAGQLSAQQICVPPSVAGLRVGPNFTHIALQPATEKGCQAQQGLTLSRSNNILLNYSDARIRIAARQIMANIAAQGARAIRAMVWYRIAELEQPHQRQDTIGSVEVPAGGIPTAFLSHVIQFAEDVRQSGIEHLVIAFGPEGRANPACRRYQWGDCFESKAANPSWQFIRKVARSLEAGNFPRITFDLSNELCFDDPGTIPFDHNARFYGEYILSRFVREFPRARFTISCTGTTAAQMQGRLRGIEALYTRLRVRPAVLEVHGYSLPLETRALLLAAQNTASKLGVPLVIGEMPADSPGLQEMARMRVNGALPSLTDVMVWPKSWGSACHMNLSTADAMRAAQLALGLRGQNGAARPVCPYVIRPVSSLNRDARSFSYDPTQQREKFWSGRGYQFETSGVR